MHVCVFVFDLLYMDGDSLVHLPLRQRRARLAAALPNLEPGHVQFATSMEFQPAAVSAAVAAAAMGSADTNTAADANASHVQPIEDQQDTGNSPLAASSSCGIHSGVNVHADKDMPDSMVTTSKETGANSQKQRATGSGDVNATGDAAAAGAAAAQGALAQTAGAASEAAAPGVEAVVSDLAVQSIEDRIQELLLESFAGGTEGLMLKALDVAAGYQPSKRSDSWIKLKRQACC